MFSFNTAKSGIDVFAEKYLRETGVSAALKDLSRYVLTTMLLLLISGATSKATGGNMSTPLEIEVQNLKTEVAVLQTDNPAAFARLHAQIAALQATLAQLNLSGSVVMTGSTMTAKRGTSFNYNVSLLPGTSQASALQGTLILPPGWILNSVKAGQAAIAAGKNVDANLINGIFLVEGLNQTLIPAGVVAIANFTIPATAFPNLVPVSIISPVASDPAGNDISISEISGTVRVTL